MRNKLPAGKVRNLYDPTFFHNKPMLWHTAGTFAALMGLVSHLETWICQSSLNMLTSQLVVRSHLLHWCLFTAAPEN